MKQIFKNIEFEPILKRTDDIMILKLDLQNNEKL